MSDIVKTIIPSLFLILLLASACVPSQSAIQAAPSGTDSTLFSLRERLQVYTGNVTAISESYFLAQTADVPGKDYSEAYFDFPLDASRPFFISFRIDYPSMYLDDTVELVFPDYTYGFVPASSEHYLTYKDKSLRSSYWRYDPREAESAKLQKNNLIYIYAPGGQFPESNFYINYIYQFQEGYFGLGKTTRFGFRIRAKKGERKTASISNFVIASGPLAAEAFAMIQEEGKSIADGYYAQRRKLMEEETAKYEKRMAEKKAQADPIKVALDAREERRRLRAAEQAANSQDLMGQLLTGLFRSVGNYIKEGSQATSGVLYQGARAILICNDYDGIERETGVSIECSSSDTYVSCSDRLAAELRESGYDYVSSYCDIANPDPGLFESDVLSRHGYISIR
jgi:hypothetical protein